MSFFTALFGGLGGYGQGRQQRQQFDLNQQDFNLRRQQMQQDAAYRQQQMAMQQAQWKETARQNLINRGVNPATAQYDPTSGEYQGGSPFAMPKGWQVVPKDPNAALQHWQNLMNIYAQQGRIGTDEAKYAEDMYSTASASSLAAQKFAQELGLKQYEVQHEDARAAMLQQGEWGRLQYGKSVDVALAQAKNELDLRIKRMPTAGEGYAAMAKTPDNYLAAASKELETLHGKVGAIVSNLNSVNTNASAAFTKNPMHPGEALPLDQMPNPDMTGFSNTLSSVAKQVEADPSKLGKAINLLTAANNAWRAKQNGQPVPQGAKTFVSDAQASAAITLLQNVANASLAKRKAQHAINIISNAEGQGVPPEEVPPVDYGGSDGGGNPTGGGRIPPDRIWDMLVQNGATPREATTLTAVALAESGGNPTAKNLTDNNGKQSSWGLFQISDGTHRELPGWHDPLTNVRMAIGKLRSQGLGAWGTYNTRKYRQFLPAGVTQ